MLCKKCHADKPVHMFYNNARNKTGKSLYCKSCCNGYVSAWAKNNRGKARAATSKWQAQNKESRKAYDARPERVAARKQLALKRRESGAAAEYQKEYYRKTKQAKPEKLLWQAAKGRANRLGLRFSLKGWLS